MVVYISKKLSWVRFVISFLIAAGITLLLCVLFSGPLLGFHYDFLAKLRSNPRVAPELVLIDASVPARTSQTSLFLEQSETENVLEPSAAISLLLTAAELGTSTMIIETPILGLSAGIFDSEENIRGRLNDEFGIIGRNIHNLFDAIRLGSVAPADASRYVAELINLSEQGKERLLSTLIRRDDEIMAQLDIAINIFNNVRRSGNLHVHVIRSGDTREQLDLRGIFETHLELGEYFRARPDRDGVIRRIAPVLDTGDGITLNHIVYSALLERYESSRIENIRDNLFMINIKKTESDRIELTEQIIPLDDNGALIFEINKPGDVFKKIHVTDFLDYDEAERSLRRLLEEAETLGAFRGIEGENNPLFLHDYVNSLREDILEGRSKEDKLSWINARLSFFTALDDFLYGASEMYLIMAYEELIAADDINPDGVVLLTGYRDNLIQLFAGLRAKYQDILKLREKLSVLDGAFCILGNFSGSDLTNAEASALLANSLLTGYAIKPGPFLWMLIGSIFTVFLTALLLRSSGAASTLFLGIFFSIFWGLFFSAIFIFTGVWFDPLVPVTSIFVLSLISFIWPIVLKRRFVQVFTQSYGNSVSNVNLKKIIAKGQPLPKEFIITRAAVFAIRNPKLLILSDQKEARSGAEAFLAFRKKTSEFVLKAGGTVLASEGDTVLACFGSPLENVSVKEGAYLTYDGSHIDATDIPAIQAADFIASMQNSVEGRFWHYGLDIGNCCFIWSALCGYNAYGRPVIRAKLLSQLVARYGGRPLISEAVNSILSDLPTKKLAVLKNTDGSGGEVFFELLL